MPEPGDILDRTAQEIVKAAALPSRFAFEQVLDFLEGVGDCFSLLLRSLRYMFACPITWLDSVSQMANIGVNSLVIVMLTVAFSGAVVALYSSLMLVKWGVSAYVGGGLAITIVREIGPVLTAVVVTARSGSAMAAEIGSMKVTEQIDALRSLAISPVEYLVTPRLIACLVVMPMLTVFATFTGSVGGYVVAVANGVASGTFIASVERLVDPYDLTMGLLKSVAFGLVIALVCCQQGLRTHGGATGVGRSTTNAVVISIVAIYILNFFLTYLMFGRSG